MGIEHGQVDPGHWLLKKLEAWKLVWDVGVPRNALAREDLAFIAAGTAPDVVAPSPKRRAL
jgi:hypothetical protein